jgi:DNA-binding CsgD family transcriptional regulator
MRIIDSNGKVLEGKIVTHGVTAAGLQIGVGEANGMPHPLHAFGAAPMVMLSPNELVLLGLWADKVKAAQEVFSEAGANGEPVKAKGARK